MFMLIVFHQVGGDRCRAPGQGPPQWSSMRLIWTGKKRKPGCSAHSDPEGEVSALWLPRKHLLYDSKCAPVWHVSPHTSWGVSPGWETSVSGHVLWCWWGRMFRSEGRAYRLAPWPSFSSAELRQRALSPPGWPCHVILSALCFVLSESCTLYTLPVRRVKTVFTTPEAKCPQGWGSDGGWVSSLGFFRPESKNIPAAFCAQTRRSDNHYVSSCLHMQICVWVSSPWKWSQWCIEVAEIKTSGILNVLLLLCLWNFFSSLLCSIQRSELCIYPVHSIGRISAFSFWRS